ncbi:hypothetical protein OROMI_007257 [Orobanche minor]
MKDGFLRRESPRLKKHKICVDFDESNRCTRAMKKKIRDISTVTLDLRNSFKGNIANVEDGDDILKADDDSDFEVSREKKKCKVAVEMKSDNITVGDGSIYVCSRFLKMWSFYYDEHNRNFHGKATYWNDFKVPETILHKLSETQLELFMRTPFSQYLNFETPKMYSQILHQALIREIYQRDDAEIWFEFGEKRVRFGLPEFCLITGLNGVGNVDVSVFSAQNSVLIDKYFGECRVTRALIDSVYKSVAFVDDEEAVRMSVIYMLFNFLLAAAPPRFVDRGLLVYAAIGDLNVLSWGKICYDMTIRSLFVAVKGVGRKLKNGCVEYNMFKDRYTKLYKLCGFPYCFQVFLYECIPTLMDRGICTRSDDSNLRILSWKETGKPPTNEQLNDFVFGSGQMRVQLISPTLEELKELKFLECFRFLQSNSVGNVVDHDISSKPKKVFVGASFRSPEFKKVIDDRIKPLEESISSVNQSIENLRNDLKDQLLVMQDKILSQMTILLTGEVCGKGLVEECGKSDPIICEGLKNVDLDHVSGESLKKYNNAFVNETSACPGNVNSSSFFAGEDVVGICKVREFPSFELLSQESILNGGNLDFGKELDVVVLEKAVDEVESSHKEQDDVEVEKASDEVKSLHKEQDVGVLEKASDEVKSSHKEEGKRACVKSAALRSPFTTEFGSAEGKELVLYPKDIRKGISAFPDECMQWPDEREVLLFDEWFKIGFNSKNRKYKFPGSNDIIKPPFHFGDTSISSKMWFYSLLTPNKWLDDDHINVASYYLRKLARHSSKVHVKVTIVDSWFHVKLTTLYNEFCEKGNDRAVLMGDTDIREYISGYLMCLNTPWVDVEYVLIPINMDNPGHWFLLVFDVHRRCLVVYNTLEQGRKAIQDRILSVCQPYVVGLPIILAGCNFWGTRNDVDHSSDLYSKYGLDDHFLILFAKSIPEQVECDCGIFTIGLAEHFIYQKIADMMGQFSVRAYRKKLCVNLFIHARNKEIFGYESDIEHPGRYGCST